VTLWQARLGIDHQLKFNLLVGMSPELAPLRILTTRLPMREWQDWADPVLQKPYEIRDGLLHIPDVPGVGLEWNEEAVAASRAYL
jgi:mandelate racemase